HIDDLVFIFDRYVRIEAGISKVFPDTTHTICFWHFSENVKKRFHRNDVATLMDKVARSYTELKELRNLYQNAFNYVIEAVPNDIVNRVVLNPLSRRQTGRLRGGRHASFSERTTTQSCRRCGESGHNARRCHNPPLINDGPSRIVPPEYRHKCSICHSVGHNKQRSPDNGPTVV
ncbi:hypothetical protein Ddye_008588, partial [Dipteronia dyeriana]